MDVKPQSRGLGQSDSESAELSEPRVSDGARPDSWGSFAWFMVQLLVAVLVFRAFVFSPFTIPSESMLPRLMNGDYLLAAKWPYGYSAESLPFDVPLTTGRLFASPPERGDIVIFKHPLDGRDYIKRVIALPGDTIGVVGGQLLLNGTLVPRERRPDLEVAQSVNTGCEWGGDLMRNDAGDDVCRYRRFRETLPGGRSYDVLDFGPTRADSFAPVTVPEGRMFVMGDNRDNSQDSRFPAAAGYGVGMVPQDLLVGRASVIVWSSDGSAEWLKPWTWVSATRWGRIGEGQIGRGNGGRGHLGGGL